MLEQKLLEDPTKCTPFTFDRIGLNDRFKISHWQFEYSNIKQEQGTSYSSNSNSSITTMLGTWLRRGQSKL